MGEEVFVEIWNKNCVNGTKESDYSSGYRKTTSYNQPIIKEWKDKGLQKE